MHGLSALYHVTAAGVMWLQLLHLWPTVLNYSAARLHCGEKAGFLCLRATWVTVSRRCKAGCTHRLYRQHHCLHHLHYHHDCRGSDWEQWPRRPLVPLAVYIFICFLFCVCVRGPQPSEITASATVSDNARHAALHCHIAMATYPDSLSMQTECNTSAEQKTWQVDSDIVPQHYHIVTSISNEIHFKKREKRHQLFSLILNKIHTNHL